jgi:hypothetical protein
MNNDTKLKVRYTYDVVLAVEMAPAAIEMFGVEPVIEPNGRSYFVLGEKRASCVLPDDATEAEAVRKCVATAAFFYKNDNPEWADSPIRGLSPDLIKRSLVR